MLEIPQAIFALLLTLGILVTIHEWGHYWVAKRAGVKVLKFSIGFGRPIYQWQRGETTFVIAWIPLGGYVKMLGEGDDEEISAADAPRAFSAQPLKVRAAIVAAGPVVNLIFAVFAYALMYMNGVSGIKPLIGEVTPSTPAAVAGFNHGDEIVAINNERTAHWSSAIQALLTNVVDGNDLAYQVKNPDGVQRSLSMPASVLEADDFSKKDLLEKLGLSILKPSAKIGEVMEGKPAALAGIQAGDLVLKIDDTPVKSWHHLAKLISKTEKAQLKLDIQRGSEIISVDVSPQGKLGEKRIGIAAAWKVEDFYSIEHYGFFAAIEKGAAQAWAMTRLTFQMFGKMLTAEVSTKNIGGPVTIADFAGKSLGLGLSQFLGFLALLSLSLGILNLLPIPLLDGGHLLVYLLEWLKGSALSERSIIAMQQVGLTLILLLMGLALFNDFSRLFGD